MGISLDLVELDGKPTPRAIVDEIVRQNPELPIPVPIEEFASLAGILHIKPLTTDGVEGMLISNPEKSEGVVFVNTSRPKQRQRFTVGHELGHFLLPWHRRKSGEAVSFKCSPEDMRAYSAKGADPRLNWEVQANEFSSELLMPKAHFRIHGKKFREPDLNCVAHLAAQFDTSMEATARRYITLNDFPVAVVFAKDDTVRYTFKGPEFKYRILQKKGSKLPVGSSCLRRADDDSIGSVNSFGSEAWLDGEMGPRPPEELLEQTLFQREGYKIILLYAEPDDEDE